MSSWLRSIDDRLFFAVNHFAADSGWLQQPVLFFAKYGVALFAVLLGLTLVRNRRADSRALAVTGWTAIATLCALGINQPIGNLIGEARPYTTHPHIFLLAQRSADFSFPSDHAVMAGAVTAGLLLAWRSVGLVAVAAAALMAFARVYIGAHYPWDVLAGLGVGALVTLAGWALLSRPLIAVTEWLRCRRELQSAFGVTGRSAAPARQ